eukprot:666961-Pyramimonas_sp.AAC.1
MIQGRVEKGRKRAVQISKLVQTAPQIRILAKTGRRPAATHGQMTQGHSPTALSMLRSSVAALTDYKKPGGCPTSCIRLGSEEKNDC